MQNRRSFLLHTSLAACAVTILKPLQSFSFFNNDASKPVSNALSIVFAGNLQGKRTTTATIDLASIGQQVKAANGNALLLDLEDLGTFSTNTGRFSAYSVVQKGSTTVGVIVGTSSQHGGQLMNEVNETAALLRNEHHCSLVVCIFTAKEIENLAKQTVGIDVVIGTKDYSSIHHSRVCRNIKNEEVMVAYTGPKDSMIGRIDFVFNDKKEKISVNTNPILIGIETKDLSSLKKHDLLRA